MARRDDKPWDSGSRNPGESDADRELRERLELSSEELRVLRQCNVESFWYRSMPIATGLSFATHMAVQKGYLQGNQRFGSTPKVLLATVIGYVIGKFSYRQRCADMIMQLPNSKLADALRRQKDMGSRPLPSNDQLSVSIHTNPTEAQIADSRPSFEERKPDSDYHHPDLDLSAYQERPPEPIAEEQQEPPKPSAVQTYEDLRRKNRDDFETRRYEQMKRHVSGPPPPPSYPSSSPPPPKEPGEEPDPSPRKGAIRNKYGDVWDK